MTVWGIVVAGGQGTRFGAPKQFQTLGGARLVDHAVAAAVKSCDRVVLVLPPEVTWDGAAVTELVIGGEHRSDSVRAGLAAVPDEVEVVVVHDAARPLAAPALFDAVIQAIRDGAAAAVPAVPVSDTLKRVVDGRVTETVDRDGLVGVQTPQAFRAGALRQAHASRADATDDAALVEAAGGTVVSVAGDPRNLKVTSPQDLALAEAILRGES